MADFDEASGALAAIGRRFDERGWVLGTSGNLSTVIARTPLRMAITRSGAHKGTLAPADILELDDTGAIVRGGPGGPSAETALHVEIVASRGAGAVMHTHSIWATLLSDRAATQGGL